MKKDLGDLVTRYASGAVLAGGLFFHWAKALYGKASIPPITRYIGDFAFIAAPILLTNYLSRPIENLGKKYNSEFVEHTGRYLTEITAAGTAAYFTLGELGQIPLSGVADGKDIPAVLVASLASYLAARRPKL